MKTSNNLPERGYTRAEMEEMLLQSKSGDARWDLGKIFGFVYHPGQYYARVVEHYLQEYLYESTINPTTFPSLKNFERDIVRMAAGLMHGDKNVTGNVTTGGTESIFLALKVARDTARDMARDREKKEGQFEVILPETSHPAFLKACEYLSLKPVVVPVSADKRADPEKMEAFITDRTILLACSAPCFPYGVVDPVEKIGEIAAGHRLMLHVDACLGGFMLPFLEDLGYRVPGFDFRVPGITSISLDAHKYGYAPKGTSILLFRNRSLRKKQFFVHTEWPGGIFASTTFMGTKSGGPLAGCWAVMNHLGREGYRTIAGQVMKTTLKITEGIRRIEGLQLVAEPDMSVVAFTSSRGQIHQIGDALASRGWHLDRLQFPDALHLTITQLNIGQEEQFLTDLNEVADQQEFLEHKRKGSGISSKLVTTAAGALPGGLVGKVARKAGKVMGEGGDKSGGSQSALYGISASFRNRKNMKQLVLNMLDGMF